MPDSTCRLAWCDRKRMVRYDLCELHHRRKKRGYPLDAPIRRCRKGAGDESRFWDDVSLDRPEDPDKCWEWIGPARTEGHGLFYTNDFPHPASGTKNRGAHVYAWLREHGEITETNPMTGKLLSVLHKCGNAACVRVSHLYLGTEADNAADAVRLGELKRGSDASRSVLSPEQVLEIRRKFREGASQVSLVQEYGVWANAIHEIVRYKSWTHLP